MLDFSSTTAKNVLLLSILVNGLPILVALLDGFETVTSDSHVFVANVIHCDLEQTVKLCTTHKAFGQLSLHANDMRYLCIHMRSLNA